MSHNDELCFADVMGRIEIEDVNLDVARGYMNHMLYMDMPEGVRKVYLLAYNALCEKSGKRPIEETK